MSTLNISGYRVVASQKRELYMSHHANISKT
ncbi:hypothetical protein DNG97_07245 [Vibrio parahaemolyticus]|uniref:Uncharacterized protein n=1 Tax=Vibrio parahaemolyticus TaxID=670 RepID=A0AA46L7T4_VIBPH|nr:hypothetical protein [Vibrio parahaemolyticus]EGQ8288247.1 hypothetical protein [Vibrio parahaemolyticus]EGQ8295858.1 hypothetical protein [Vibrio parahaemolyticus]EGQ8325719.1 hypothetical protein [Vibrio parahaemolyticus]EGQ8350677.1 hypothetical protein [Vibrio parahaemolyticus]